MMPPATTPLRRAAAALAVAAVAALVAAGAAVAEDAPGTTAATTAPVPSGPGHVAFVRIDKTGTDIWTVNPDGSDIKQITTSHTASQPAWSRDGTQIAYVGAGGIWLMAADGSGGRLAVAAADVSRAARPAWSPDAKQIAFSGKASVYVAPLDGSAAPRKLATGTDPAWSPDGRSIAYVDSQNGAKARVWIVGADGSGAHGIGRLGLFPAHLSWKLGDYIAFTGTVKKQHWLYVVSSDGKAMSALTSGPTGGTLSPNDDRSFTMSAPTKDGKGILSTVRGSRVTPIGPGLQPDWGH